LIAKSAVGGAYGFTGSLLIDAIWALHSPVRCPAMQIAQPRKFISSAAQQAAARRLLRPRAYRPRG
jgi:hypothetical protein